MPPRKSTASLADTTLPPTTTSPNGTHTTPPPPPRAPPSRSRTSTSTLAIEDLTLPRSMIQRLAKGVLPQNTQIQKDAVLALSKSATVFVSYLVNSANDRAVLANKKTVMPKDVLDALGELEFEGFVGRVTGELEKYNTVACTKRNDYRRRLKEDAGKGTDASAGGGSEADMLDTSVTASMLANMANGGGGGDVSMMNGRDHDGEPSMKKMRTGNGLGSGRDGDETEDDVNAEGEEEDYQEDEPEEDELEEMEEDGEGDDGEGGEERLENEERRGLEDEEQSGNESD